ncbi:hypothetical protein [Burkholderia sp. TSV86]|uniref:hypothetical protein n=1 Tax=Burkholderia sp. TSV86 TaxID=1385594 RepID=UPI000A9007DA|nr:hypothetical protein [Burkholderia sp. TSV86]
MELHQTPDPQPVKQPPVGDPPQSPKNDQPVPAQPRKPHSAFSFRQVNVDAFGMN